MPSLAVSRLPAGAATAHPECVESQDPPLLAYCLVANVAEQTAHGEGGLELRSGLRHFAPGAKVWVLPPQWGDGGAKLLVAGHHRGAGGRRGYVRIVVSRRHLTNFRVQGIYSPALLAALTRPVIDPGSTARLWSTREAAEESAAFCNACPVEAVTDGYRLLPPVGDPPPMELHHEGSIYYLAHFNARRAVYSRQPPPAELSSDG
jgi:hypothetical protein